MLTIILFLLILFICGYIGYHVMARNRLLRQRMRRYPSATKFNHK